MEAERWTPPPPGVVYLSSHNALGKRGREGPLGCLEEQQQGSFSQMDMCLLWDLSSSVTVMRTTQEEAVCGFFSRGLCAAETQT